MTSPLLQKLDFLTDLEAAYLGPPLAEGPLPALFYFSLSAEDSLCLDPVNQPVAYLSGIPLRIFSISLPGHEDRLPPTDALNVWAEAFARGHNLVASFVDRVKDLVDALAKRGAFIEDKVAVAGLSRGAFIAAHAAARIPEFQTLLGFAPLTRLSSVKEFHQLLDHPLIASLSLENLTDKLVGRPLRFYIGNLDTRVGTRHCFDFIQKLSQESFAAGIRSPQVELIIGPSIGKDGHGTSKDVFQSGAQWAAEQLKAIDVL